MICAQAISADDVIMRRLYEHNEELFSWSACRNIFLVGTVLFRHIFLTFSRCCTFEQVDGGLLLRRSLSWLFAAGLVFLLGCSAWAESDLFLRSVGLALTGTDNADLKVIDRASCVFAIKNELFHLNNVYTDRIKVEGWQEQRFGKREQGTRVVLQGGETVFETIVESPKDDGSELMQHMRAESPEMFQPHHYKYTQTELRLSSNNQQGVKGAWQYIYAHGCTGGRAP